MNLPNTTFSYNGGKEFTFDAGDADDEEKLEIALKNMGKDEKDGPKDGKASDIIRNHCGIIKRFFDACLGDNAGNEICGSGSNLTVCYDAYEKFLEMVREQKDAIVGIKSNFSSPRNNQPNVQKSYYTGPKYGNHPNKKNKR